MSKEPRPDILADLAYLVNDVDVPATIRTQAATALTAHALAVKIANDYRTDQISAAADLDQINKITVNDLADALIAGKPISIDRAIDKITNLTDKHYRQNDLYKISDQIKTATSHRCGKIIHQHRADLILWCARKRANDLTRCGEILPDEVRRIWSALDVRWWQHYDHALTLTNWLYNGKLISLPIEWRDDWDETSRASLAWMYGELAAGRYELIKVKHDELIRLTGVVIELPKVPAMKHQPKYRGW